jgi:tryptophan halogenase
MKNIVVVGGGTAGWITALYAKQIFPDDNITLVESPEIGILGAGEGSTRQLISILKYLDIAIEDLIKETKCTIKTGIKFTNWSKEKDYYYHDFTHEGSIFDESGFDRGRNNFDFPILKYERLLNIVEKNTNTSVNDEYSDNKLLPFTALAETENNKSFLHSWNIHSDYSIHFDARLLASFLSNLGILRKIKLIKGEVVNIETNNQNDIVALKLNNNDTILTDFVFDCSGFARLIIGKHYNSKWQSFSEYLPMKRALPFFIDIDTENIPSYTEAIAMDYGWIWKIPLQHRYGCGYVFDSDYINEDQAQEEIEKFLGFKPTYPKTNGKSFIFDPGFFEEVWINNCLAVGLSSGFLEPLEATSIGQSILLLQRFFMQKHKIFSNDVEIKKLFNEYYIRDAKSIVDFLSLHYTTNKDNSDFWINFNKNNKKSQNLLNNLEILKNSTLTKLYDEIWFSKDSYYIVALGNNLVDLNNINKIYKEFIDENKHSELVSFILNKKNISKDFIKHSDFLKHIGGLQQ